MADQPRVPLWLPRPPPAFYDSLRTDIRNIQSLAATDVEAAQARFEEVRPRLHQIVDGERLARRTAESFDSGYPNFVPVLGALEKKTPTPGVTLMLKGFGAVGVLAGYIGTFVLTGTMLDARASADWPRTEGMLQSVEVEMHTSRSSSGSGSSRSTTTSRSWEVKILYGYDVDGRAYTGHRKSFDDAESYHEEEEAEAAAARYRASPEVAVYYEPDDPSFSVLTPGATTSSELEPFLVLIAAIVGAFMLLDRLRTLKLRIIISVVPAVLVAIVELVLFG